MIRANSCTPDRRGANETPREPRQRLLCWVGFDHYMVKPVQIRVTMNAYEPPRNFEGHPGL
jgi:hypothetical protein